MPEWFTIVAAIVALGGGTFGAVNGYRTMRKTSPIEEMRKEHHAKWSAFYSDKWDVLQEEMACIKEIIREVDSERARNRFREIDEKLDSDNRRLKFLEENVTDNKKCLKLLLRSQQQLLEHEISGNHADRLRESANDIADFLVEHL